MMLSNTSLHVLDRLLYGFHILVILVNVLGWMVPRFRVWQRRVLLLTALSWLGLGLFYGIGYCFLTDWHWEIKRRLGESAIPHSFIQYILQEQLGFSFSDRMVDFGTGTVFVSIVLITLGQIVWEIRRKSSS